MYGSTTVDTGTFSLEVKLRVNVPGSILGSGMMTGPA